MRRGTRGKLYLIFGILLTMLGVQYTISICTFVGFVLIGYNLPEAVFGNKIEEVTLKLKQSNKENK